MFRGAGLRRRARRYRRVCSCDPHHAYSCSCSSPYPCSCSYRRSTLGTATDFALDGSRGLLARILYGRRRHRYGRRDYYDYGRRDYYDPRY